MRSIKPLFLAFCLIFFGSVFFIELTGKENVKRSKNSINSKLPTITFWQYWTGSEKKPIADLIEKFNREYSEDYGFTVDMLTISLPRKKVLMATVGNVPPDLVHLDGDMVSDFALRNALSDLDPLINSMANDSSKLNPKLKITNNLNAEKFIPIYYEMLNIRNKQWAIPYMPTCEAMHINKKLLAKYGIHEAPKTLEDIEKVFNAVTDFDNFQRIGWLPSWPPWVGRFLPVVFGGAWGEVMDDGKVKITANSPENIRAWNWVQERIASKIPKNKLRGFTEYHSYQSPDNPFYSGKIAVENNGVWEQNLAKKFAPDLEIEIAPFPVAINSQFKNNADIKNKKTATLVTVDALAIPKSAKNPKLAIQFINWLMKKENLEYLALEQKKFTPIKDVSDGFVKNHPNKFIQVFIDLANSPNAKAFPQISLVQKYRREIKEGYSKVVRMETSPKEALDHIQSVMEEALAKSFI